MPIGVVAFVATFLIVPDMRPGRAHRLDVGGVLLASAGLFAITFGLIEGQRYDWGRIWGPITIVEVIAVGVALLGAFFLLQWREKGEPLVPFRLLRDRNYSLMNLVAAAMSFAMLGLFLPFVIYLQSVLGLTALAAGLVLAPLSLVSMVVAPVAGRLADRWGGKFLLIGGLALFAAGSGYLLLASTTTATHWAFLPGLIIGGVGMGCIFAPMTTIAMHDVEPRFAGAASGLLNTTRQLGGVIGSAAVGAVLQTQLVNAMRDEALRRAAALPAGIRDRVVSGFGTAGRSGLEVGRGQTGGRVALPHDTPAAVVARVERFARDVFNAAFVHAMRASLIVPVLVLAAAAAAGLLSRRT